MARPGNTVSHQPLGKSCRALERMDPQLGLDGGTPNPKKLSVDSIRMADATPNVAATNTGAILLGRIWRKIVRKSLAPSAWAATTYSNDIGSQEMLCRRRPKYAGQAYLIRRISDRRKLRPVALLEVHRGEVFKGNILKRRLPTRNTEPRGVIFQNGKINLTSITHHERFVIRYEISGSRKYEQQENDNQTGCGDTILAELA